MLQNRAWLTPVWGCAAGLRAAKSLRDFSYLFVWQTGCWSLAVEMNVLILSQMCFWALLCLKNWPCNYQSWFVPIKSFLFLWKEHHKKSRTVTSRVKIQTPMIVHCLHISIKFFWSSFLLDKIHTNEIQVQSVNSNEKVNSVCKEASAYNISSGIMIFFFCTDHEAITVFQN